MIEFGFTIDASKPRILSWNDGGCRPATDEECALWDAVQAKPDAWVVSDEDVEAAHDAYGNRAVMIGSTDHEGNYIDADIDCMRTALESFASRHARQVPDGYERIGFVHPAYLHGGFLAGALAVEVTPVRMGPQQVEVFVLATPPASDKD